MKSDAWVDSVIANLPVSPRTVIRYMEMWGWIQKFCTRRHIKLSQFAPHQADLYLDWRTSTKIFSSKNISKNTALQELKFVKYLQRHARLRGKMKSRPMDDYTIRLAARRMKPALSDEQIDRIRVALVSAPEWMAVSFEIGLATGARLQECAIPCRCIDLQSKTILFESPKGGFGKAFTIPIPATILPLLTAIKNSGKEKTCEIHKTKASFRWRRFFDRLGMRDVCFHCLRVTRVTRLRQAGVPAPDARRLVNHSSELIHRLYDRHQVEELRQYVDAGAPKPNLSIWQRFGCTASLPWPMSQGIFQPEPAC